MGADKSLIASMLYPAVQPYHPMVADAVKPATAMIPVNIGSADISSLGCRGTMYYNVRNLA